VTQRDAVAGCGLRCRSRCVRRPHKCTDRCNAVALIASTTNAEVTRMPRPRAKTGARKTAAAKKSSAAKTRSAKSTSSSGTFTCPECGKTFSRAASLGAHRNRAHGVVGRSARSSNGKAATRRLRTTTRASRTTVDRDALLRVLFPSGIPARESVIRDLNAWLDQAERLARQS